MLEHFTLGQYINLLEWLKHITLGHDINVLGWHVRFFDDHQREALDSNK